MPAKKAFLLSAGFGTRFKPQSLYFPKPALPFLNLPQALFPAAALMSAGVEDFFYNSHHLPDKLNSALSPFFKRNSIFEKEILDSAGGIANAKNELFDQDNFWVANGDSLVFLNDSNVLNDAYDFHIQNNAVATLIGIKKPDLNLSGLDFDSSSKFTGISKNTDSLHFIGFYIFKKEIWEHFKTGRHHIFHDVLLKSAQDKTFVFNAENRISWYESGNEKDFLDATKQRLDDLRAYKEKSQTYKALLKWNKNTSKNLSYFLDHKVWGCEYTSTHKITDFLCVGENFQGDLSKFDNCIIGDNLTFEANQKIKNKFLVHSSQWA